MRGVVEFNKILVCYKKFRVFIKTEDFTFELTPDTDVYGVNGWPRFGDVRESDELPKFVDSDSPGNIPEGSDRRLCHINIFKERKPSKRPFSSLEDSITKLLTFELSGWHQSFPIWPPSTFQSAEVIG